MIRILQRLRQAPEPEISRQDAESAFFTTVWHQGNQEPLVPWEARAVELGARPLPARPALRQLQALWAHDRHLSTLGADALARMERYLHFAAVKAQRDVILQDEYGNFMVVVLSGELVVNRRQPWGETLRLAQTGPGDLLGEMSLLDSGQRFSSCTTLVDSELAVLSAEALDDMLAHDPALAAQLIAILARKLSVRLRAVSSRLGQQTP
ncbi:Crp/Fnr family transcriptional regulator [Comamonas sp.]|uniref:Crp/Fnr family transcriptional regulator n=1 Tax=Comamonas sp. TaxID=34028 RepID=UPI003FA57CCE